MTTNNSMNNYIQKTVKHYSSLFTLPSHKKIIWLLLILSLLSGILVSYALHPSVGSHSILPLGLSLGVTLFVLIMVTDFMVHSVSLRRDLIFNLRRCSALSLYSLLVWFSFILLGIIADIFNHALWLRLFLLGFCVVFALRLLVLWSASFASVVKVSFSAALLPALYTLLVVVYTMNVTKASVPDASVVFFLSSSLAVTIAAILLFTYAINRIGLETLGIGAFSVFRAFLASWAEDLNEPFEQIFERFSLERDIKVSILAFKANGRTKAMIVVPTFHPGPFKNIGSSNLPYTIQKTLEKELQNCVIAVPHGLSGHDLDLASQAQNQLVLKRVQKLTEFSELGSVATPFVKVKRNDAFVGCQICDKCALVTLTLAPETMEDLPSDLEAFIVDKAQKLGLSTAISVDAHNSIQGPFNINKAMNPLKEAATSCLEKASKQAPAVFKVGVAKVIPREFGLKEGMGQGGIVATIIKVGDQHTAYITIDGNNMLSGLRERILSALSEVGVDDGEVFTTDTHAVNAVVLNTRGYHPVGEALNQETLINYVKQAVMDALANLEWAEVAWRAETVSGVKVVGEKQIEAMCMLLDEGIERAKKLAVSLFPIVGVILGVLLLLV